MLLNSISVSRLQRGITLIESLVALVITALGILGIVGVQMRTLADTQTTVRRAQAVKLIEDLSERLKVHPNALNAVNPTGNAGAKYVSSTWSLDLESIEPNVDCKTTKCKPDELAAYDLWAWRTLVRETLPAGDGLVFLPQAENDADGNRRQLGVLLRWRENERPVDDAQDLKLYKEHIDTTKTKKSDGSFVSGTGLPDSLDKGCGESADGSSYTCHLQYIPISGRCAPDFWAGQIWYYCAGA